MGWRKSNDKGEVECRFSKKIAQEQMFIKILPLNCSSVRPRMFDTVGIGPAAEVQLVQLAKNEKKKFPIRITKNEKKIYSLPVDSELVAQPAALAAVDVRAQNSSFVVLHQLLADRPVANNQVVGPMVVAVSYQLNCSNIVFNLAAN